MSRIARLTKEQILQRFKDAHEDTYSYEFVDWNNVKTTHSKIDIYCKKHKKIFKQEVGNHFRQDCPLCMKESRGLTKEIVLKRFKEKHGDEYNYDKIDWGLFNKTINKCSLKIDIYYFVYFQKNQKRNIYKHQKQL